MISKKITKFDFVENEILENINLFINSETEEKNKIFISKVSSSQDILKVNDKFNDKSLNKFNDLVSHKGYLYELYDIYCYNLNWLTGWEISKKYMKKL